LRPGAPLWLATTASPDKEGRKELADSAKAHAAKREIARSAYHLFEYGSASFQLAIVLASAAAVTSVMLLAYAGLGAGSRRQALTALAYSRQRCFTSEVRRS
jgi:hypothetical protein